jgi:2-amino-4-hydroxy-6-hydroxymethyldihydropteridine diphosphokinase
MHEIVIGLGANLGDPPSAFAVALAGLAREGRVVALSRLWRTRPVGPAQPDYLNAAALVVWPNGPWRLLESCRALELAAATDPGALIASEPFPSAVP